MFFILIGSGGASTTILAAPLSVSVADQGQNVSVAQQTATVTHDAGINVTVSNQAPSVTVAGNINVEVD